MWVWIPHPATHYIFDLSNNLGLWLCGINHIISIFLLRNSVFQKLWYSNFRIIINYMFDSKSNVYNGYNGPTNLDRYIR